MRAGLVCALLAAALLLLLLAIMYLLAREPTWKASRHWVWRPRAAGGGPHTEVLRRAGDLLREAREAGAAYNPNERQARRRAAELTTRAVQGLAPPADVPQRRVWLQEAPGLTEAADAITLELLHGGPFGGGPFGGGPFGGGGFGLGGPFGDGGFGLGGPFGDGGFGLGGFLGGPYGRGGAEALIAALMPAVRERRMDITRERVRAAREATTGAPAATTAAYINLATTHTNDSQNVHDSAVLASLRGVVERLRAERTGPLPSLAQVEAHIRAEQRSLSAAPGAPAGRPAVVRDVLGALERVRRGESVHSLGVTDGEALSLVWARAADPRNAANAAAIRQSVFDNLADCWEGSEQERAIVCVNGRLTRILSSLVMLDFDRRNWDIRRVEQLKNEIFARAGDVIMATARDAAASPDAATRQAGLAYLASTPAEVEAAGEASPEAAAALAREMRANIGSMVDAYAAEVGAQMGVGEVVSRSTLDAVRAEAQAAVME